ncbi:MAG: ATP-binding protein, partial [Immundisolibacteraceae bacterium]|nr:ATP-binding protein [Immundisolibacteraceae bacterium]
MAQQLPLDIHLRVDHRLDNFLISSNQARELVEKLADPAQLSANEAILIYGATGTGKTHLLQGLCQTAGNLKMRCGYLPLRDLKQASPAVLEGLEQLDLLCLDDIHTIAGDNEWERGLFNLFNLSRQLDC